MYSKQISAEEIEASGFSIEDFADDYVEVWPENYDAFRLFSTLQTQWRTGMNGPTGLDYNVLFQFMLPTNQELFEDIRIMESAALTEIHKKD